MKTLLISAFLFITLICIEVWKQGQNSQMTYNQFHEYCRKKNLDSDLNNWAQKVIYDKDTGKSYSKYFCKSNFGKTYILIREDRFMVTVKEIK